MTTPPRRRPRRGGTLRILSVGQLDSLDPQLSFSMLGTETLRCVSRTLMTYPGLPAPEGSRVVPDLAAAPPEVSDGGRTFTFRLRPGVRFGPPVSRPVTAADCKHGLERLLAPATRGQAHVYLRDVVGAERVLAGEATTLDGVRCPDERTLVVRLTRPLNDLPYMLALPATSPVPHDHDGDTVVATGPYTVAEFDPERRLRLVRNPDWDPATDPSRGGWVDEIVLGLRTPREAILDSIEHDRADLPAVVNPEAALVRRYTSEPAFAGRWHANVTGCARYIALNTRVAPFDDVRVRRAVALALDKAALREVKGGELAGPVASALLPPPLLGHRPTDAWRTPGDRGDVAAAAKLLAEAGHGDGFATWIAVAEVGYGPAIGAAVRTALARVGVEVAVRTFSVPDYFATAGTPDSTVPMAGSVGWCADWPGQGARTFIRPLCHSASLDGPRTSNYARYADAEVDALIERAEESADPAVSERLWAEVDARVLRDAPYVPWLYDQHFDLISSRLRNYFPHPFLVGADWANLWLDDADGDAVG